MRVVAIIQARMGSSRLPGKVLKTVLNQPLLQYQIERLKASKLLHYTVVATSTQNDDQAIEDFCLATKTPCFRGSEHDVLERFFMAAQHSGADIVVRLTGDCPLIDPYLIDTMIQEYTDNYPNYDYLSNCLERTYPRGMDAEIFSFACLKRVQENAVKQWDREHVTPYIYQHPNFFKMKSITQKENQSRYRLTVDTSEDFALIEKIIAHLFPQKALFSLEDIILLLQQNPSWLEMNAHIQQKTKPREEKEKFSFQKLTSHEDDLKTLYNWRKDPLTREMSYHSQIPEFPLFVKQAQHKYLEQPRHLSYFATLNGKKVAFLHAEPLINEKPQEATCCKISINLNPSYRGQKLSSPILKSFEDILRENHFESSYAEIKVNNIASQRTFVKSGYQFINKQEKHILDINETFSIYSYIKRL